MMSSQWTGGYQNSWQGVDEQTQAALTAEYESNKNRKWLIALGAVAFTVILALAAGALIFFNLPKNQEGEQGAALDPEFVAWAENTFGTFEAFEAEGDGEGSVSVPSGVKAVYAEFTASDDDGLKATGIAADGSENYLSSFWFDEAGTHAAMISVNREYSQAVTRLSIESDGPWKMSMKPVSQIQPFTDSGSGSMAMAYTGDAADLNVTYQGDDLFIVTVFNESDPDGAEKIYQSLNYDGLLPMQAGPSIISIKSQGDWTFSQ